MGFEGRSAFVTGAAGGMGGTIARDLLARGAKVTAVDVAPIAEGLDGALIPAGDLTDEVFVAKAMAEAVATHGRLD